MPGFQWFGRGILTKTGGLNAQGAVNTSSGITAVGPIVSSSGGTFTGPIVSSSGISAVGPLATSSGLTVRYGATISSGITRGLTTGPSTGTDLIVGAIHTLVGTSDGGYYKIDPPTAAGQGLQFIRAGTTASTTYLIPDDTGVSTSMAIYTSSGSSDGRLITLSGSAVVELRALTTDIWLVAASRGNVAVSSST